MLLIMMMKITMSEPSLVLNSTVNHSVVCTIHWGFGVCMVILHVAAWHIVRRYRFWVLR